MTTELSQHDEDLDAGRQEDDFLAAWRDHENSNPRKQDTKTILGVTVVVPTDLPLYIERRMEELKDSTSDKDVKELLRLLFGQDPLDAWIDAGLTGRQFKVLLAWAVANGQGKQMSFTEAMEAIAKLEADEAAGKAKPVPNRADRRKASSATRGSGKDGRSSSRTSGGSTKSRTRRSTS